MDVITLIWGLLAFGVVFVVNYFIVLKHSYKSITSNKKSKKKKQKSVEELFGLSYLIPKFNLDIKKINLGYVFLLTSLANAFIISAVFMIVYIIPWGIPMQMLVGFVLLFGLIYAIYEILGRHLVKKGMSKNGN